MVLVLMDTCERITLSFVLLFIILPSQIHSEAGEGEQHVSKKLAGQDQTPPYLTKIIKDTISLLKKSHINSWDKAKTIIHDLQLQYFPPNLDFRSADDESAKSEKGGGEKMMDVVEKCVGTGIKTAEITAESAADVMGEAINKAAEKVKNRLCRTNDQESTHDEH